MLPRPPRSTLFPYTTLFRSVERPRLSAEVEDVHLLVVGCAEGVNFDRIASVGLEHWRGRVTAVGRRAEAVGGVHAAGGAVVDQRAALDGGWVGHVVLPDGRVRLGEDEREVAIAARRAARHVDIHLGADVGRVAGVGIGEGRAGRGHHDGAIQAGAPGHIAAVIGDQGGGGLGRGGVEAIGARLARRERLLRVEADVDAARVDGAQQLVRVEGDAGAVAVIGELDDNALTGRDVQHQRIGGLGLVQDGRGIGGRDEGSRGADAVAAAAFAAAATSTTATSASTRETTAAAASAAASSSTRETTTAAAATSSSSFTSTSTSA